MLNHASVDLQRMLTAKLVDECLNQFSVYDHPGRCCCIDIVSLFRTS